MKTQSKQRIGLACIGAVLSVLTAFVAAGLTGWAFHVHQYGIRAPEMFGWAGAFILFGLIALIAVAPALLTILTCGVVWCSPMGRHALLSTALPPCLGVIAIAVCILTNPKDIALSGFIVAGAACLAITIVVEVLMKNRLQNQALHGTAESRASAAPIVP